ncbi:hypothetical protein M427DRAFT_143273 [Gonapodya prolifera JEL478]|uniref:Uncharacterized protein n=1 Tax=Gonapodya prolifera (strain JEL478) TaxID=1344416 RepID=A0A139ASN8_GONPJ|nr:hypothetical protein M427DRAFT_143273 [Gonapodya prolifera JEL478]|eukprot:KXS19495.1 hypothetical protein M427DRAFT_143273 [Gonapodya prolifera JEL478]
MRSHIVRTRTMRARPPPRVLPPILALVLLMLALLPGPSRPLAQPNTARLSLLRPRPVVTWAQSHIDAFIDGVSVGPDGSAFACFSDNAVVAIQPPRFGLHNASNFTQYVAFRGPASSQYIASRFLSVPFYADFSKPAQTRPLLALADYHNTRIDFVDPYGANAANTTQDYVLLFSIPIPANSTNTPDEVTALDKFGGFYCSGGAGSPSSNGSGLDVASTLYYISPFSLSLLPEDLINVTTVPTASRVMTLGRASGLTLSADGSQLYVAETTSTVKHIWRFPILGPGVLGPGTVVVDLRTDFYGSFLTSAVDFSALRVHPSTNHIYVSLANNENLLVFDPGNVTSSDAVSTAPTPSPAAPAAPASAPAPTTTSTQRSSSGRTRSFSAPATPTATNGVPVSTTAQGATDTQSLTLIALLRLTVQHIPYATSFSLSPDGRWIYAVGACTVPNGQIAAGRGCVAATELGPLASNPRLGQTNITRV